MSKKLLGITASPRSCIDKKLNSELIEDLKKIRTKRTLFDYLHLSSEIHSNAGFEKTIPPDTDLGILHKIRKKMLRKGMSNSEVALAAALWEAYQRNVDINYLSLKDYFLPSNKIKNPNRLKENLLSSDAILISGPVYFGDRGTLVQELINFIRLDKHLLQNLAGKLYAGISVGAKRNGGQETSLIYQLLDFIALGLLAVGNDSDTTAQYGGTCWAGNIGSAYKDSYGMDTAMGTGRRLANLLIQYGHKGKLIGKVKVLFIILQDANGIAREFVSKLIRNFIPKMDAEVIDVTQRKFIRCLACDNCPQKIGVDEDYRCKISEADEFYELHKRLIYHDAIVPVAVSMSDFSKVKTNYQIFIERTRYLRRGDYALSDMMVAPLIIQEPGAMENLQIRMITSLIRHHTVVSRPMISHLIDSTLFDSKRIFDNFEQFISLTERLVIARLCDNLKDSHLTKYNPVGYVLDINNGKSEERMIQRQRIVAERKNRRAAECNKRIIPGE
jgi:multimeric flavodoxin WrbA